MNVCVFENDVVRDFNVSFNLVSKFALRLIFQRQHLSSFKINNCRVYGITSNHVSNKLYSNINNGPQQIDSYS